MNKQDIHTSTLDLIREETRSGKLVRYADVLNDLPGAVSAIDVDKENVINGIKHAIWDNSDGNPLNAILKYLGLRLVSNRDLERDPQSGAGISRYKLPAGDGYKIAITCGCTFQSI